MDDKNKIIEISNKIFEHFLRLVTNKTANPQEYASIIATFSKRASNHMLASLKVNNISDRAYFLFQIQDAIHRGIHENLNGKNSDV